MRHFGLAALVLILLTTTQASAQTLNDPSLQRQTLSTPGLSNPTGMAFLGNNDFFVIEKNSGMVKRFNSGVASLALDLAVANDSERGLLGIALDPQFSSNNFVYLYYSQSTGADGGGFASNKVTRYTFNGTTLASPFDLITFANDGTQSNGPNHNGGPLRFGPDGLLYGVIGDLNRNRVEQNQTAGGQSSNAGGIFRLTTTGAIPTGGGALSNPFLAESNTSFHKWYAYGVRNSFGMAFDPLNGRLWDTENGPGDKDEVNLVARGFNSGWSDIMGPDALDPQGLGDLVNLSGSAYSDPEFTWTTTIGVTSIGFLANSQWGTNYQDGVLVGDANNGRLYLFRLNVARDGFVLTGNLADLVANGSAEASPLIFGTGWGTITDIQTGPDGRVYIVSYGNNAIYAIVPEPSTLVLLASSVVALVVGWRRRRRGR